MLDLSRFAVILVRPDSPENIGLAARGLANAGFSDLRIVGLDKLEPPAWRTAIHAESIIEAAQFFSSLEASVSDLQLVLGSTARVRHDFPLVTLADGVRRIGEYPAETRIGLVFGNETAGLSGAVAAQVGRRIAIPLAHGVESLNVAAAAAVACFELARRRR